MELEQLKQEATRLGPWAHVATVGPDGSPHVVPVHPCWEDEVLWSMTGESSVKAHNVEANPSLCLHYQVSEGTDFDSLIVWGQGSIHGDLDTKKRLWNGVFDYDLDAFAPGGAEDSSGTAFLRIEPSKVVLLRHYGMKGREEWRA